MASTSSSKECAGRSAKTPRVLRVSTADAVYGVAFGTHIYSAVGGAIPLAMYRFTKDQAAAFYKKQGGKAEDLHEMIDEEGCALPGQVFMGDVEKSGWVRLVGGIAERWLPLDGSGLERIEETPVAQAAVPPGWQILTWQACQGAVLKTVVAGFEWGANAVVVQDAVQGRYLRIGTKRSNRPGSVLGDAKVTFVPDGAISADGDVVLVTRPMIGISWGEDMFDITGLLNDATYAAVAAAGFVVRPAQRELEAEALELGQQALAAEIRGWFSPTPPSNAELTRMAAREASALRRLWAHELAERRLLRVHEGLVQIAAPIGDGDDAQTEEESLDAALIAAAAAADEEVDPIQIWLQVALGSILELAACIPPQAGELECMAFERLITRGTQTFATAAPLSLFSAGRMSKLCVSETVAALESLVEQMPALKPAALNMLLTLATVTGSSSLVAQALNWLISGAEEDDACSERCASSLKSLWQLGSALHFETLKVGDGTDKRLDRKKESAAWRFIHLDNIVRPVASSRRLRSHRTASFEEPCPGGIYWEVTINAADLKRVVLGVWLQSKKKPVGCSLHNGAVVGPGANASPADPLPEARPGSIFGVHVTAEELTITCDGARFSCIQYKKLLIAGERIAVFVEHDPCSQVRINVGQEPLLHLPSGVSSQARDCEGASGEEGGAASAASPEAATPPPLPWGRACDPFGESPYEPFDEEPKTSKDLANVLMSIVERNVGRLGSAVGGGTPVQHTFAKSEQMNITEDGMVVNNVRESAWARVDCEITVGVTVEWSFEVLDDRENDEGTCYGLSTAECAKYDSRGSFVVRGYSGHLYCDGNDRGEKFSKIHPRSRVSFRFDYSEGRLEAWLDDQEPRVVINDPDLFVGRTLYPTVFNYHGTRTKVKLLRCSSGLRSRAALQDSFALEVTPSATAVWLGILELVLSPVRGSAPNSAEAVNASAPAATVLKVLLATATASPSLWVEFGAVRGRLMAMIEMIVIERRNDPALQQPRDIAILLISVLGVGALFGGPEQVLKVFLSIRDSGASRLGQTLVAYLLGTRRSAPIANELVLDLSRLAVSDELGSQILLRLAVNAFMDGVDKFTGIASGVLLLVGEKGEQLPLNEGAPSFVAEMLPVLSQLLAALPRRETTKLPALLGLVPPAIKALACLRRDMSKAAKDASPPRFVTDTLHGLNRFVCGVAALLMAPAEGAKQFPLDIGDADLRDGVASLALPDHLQIAEGLSNEIAGEEAPARHDAPGIPQLVSEILSATGRGEALVCELHQKSPFSKQPINAVQRAAFAVAVLSEGPEMCEAIYEDASGDLARPCWQSASLFTNSKVRPMKHAIAASEGDAASFESSLADQLTWLARSVLWAEDSLAPAPLQLSRSATAPESRRTRLPIVQRMRQLGRIHALPGQASLPHESRHDLSRAQAQLVNGAGGPGVAALIAAASAQRDAAVGRRLGSRLLRFLVRGAVAAEGLESLLPALHAALEETLAQPLSGLAYAGFSLKHAAFAELALLLREVHAHLAASAASSPLLAAFGLAMLCVPLPRDSLEMLLGSLLGGLPTLALDPAVGGYSSGYCRTHAAQLVLRTYISASGGGGGPALAALLGQIAASFDAMLAHSPATSPGPPLPLHSCTAPLEVDWDFGAFGRLCPRRLDSKRLCEDLPAAPETPDLPGSAFERGPAMAMTLKELRRQRACGVLSRDIAASLLLRLPQGAREEAAVDAVEVLQMLRAHRGEEPVWPRDRHSGVCAAALTLLRPMAELLPLEVPGVVERLLKVATRSTGQPLPSSLAVNLYFRLQLPDEQIAADAPRLLGLLGDIGQAAEAPPPTCRGALAAAAHIARQLVSRARAVSGSVLRALMVHDISEVPLSNAASAALELIGGPARCAACHMQVLGTLYGRSLVVAADKQHVAVLSLEGAADAKAVQWVKWGDLHVPPQEGSALPAVGRASVWGEQVVSCLLSAVQRALSRDPAGRERIFPELLRALAAVMPASPHWDVGIVTAVVRELDQLAAAGANDPGGGATELLEHRCTLIRLALRQERERSTDAPSVEDKGESTDATTHGIAAPASEAPAPVGVAVGAIAQPAAAAEPPEAPSLLGVLNQCAEWRGRYKLKRETNTWYKQKWHMELRLAFRAGGELEAVARWPKLGSPCPARSAKWQLEDGGGVVVDIDLELPNGRREGGRTRDADVFTWRARLVQSRGCPHLEGTASGWTSELKYEWYVVPPDPLALLRASDLGLFGKPDEGLPRPFSLLGFNTGFIEQKAEHFSTTLGLCNFTKVDGTARDLATALVKQLPLFQYITGPRDVAKVTKKSLEENWGMRESLEEEDDALGGQSVHEERWFSVGEVVDEEGVGSRPVADILAELERWERQLRLALLMRLLQVMLANRPSDAGIADCFREPSAREAFFRRALRLPDAGVVLKRCTEDFVSSTEVARSALIVAVEGLLTPFMAGGVSTLTVESDHDYHPNEDWAFRLSIPGAQRMKLKFDSRCKTESGRDFLQFYGERDLQGNFCRRLHTEEKLSGQYPAAFPDLVISGDSAWMRFQSDASEQFWGFKFTLSGEGCGSATKAVPFPAALKLLVAATNAVCEADRANVRLMVTSVLLSVSVAQPLSDEATRAAETLCELLQEPCQWSENSWSAALSLMSVAERNGRRQLLASLVTLLSTQMGPYAPLAGHAVPALLLDRMQPSSGGVFLNGRTTLLAGSSKRVCALGLPVPLLARAGHALFCVKVEPVSVVKTSGATDGRADKAVVSAAGGGIGVGMGVSPLHPDRRGDAAFDTALFCDVTSIAHPGEEISVEVQRHGPGGNLMRLLVAGRLGTVQRELPAEWRCVGSLLPALWVEGFGASLTLRPPPSASHDSEAAAGRLEQLQRTSQLVEACRGGRGTPLPAALVAGAWARREGGDEADVASVQDRLRSRCAVVAESEHPHAWGVDVQKLEVVGASAMEISFPRLDLAEGYRLRITHDVAGELCVMKPSPTQGDGGVQHTVQFGKYMFATLDDVEPQSREKSKQEGWCKVPAGWELVPGQPDVVREVIAKHHWATDVIVVGSGEAYYTLSFEHGSKAGQNCGKDKLSSRGSDRNSEYQPNQVSGRILIRRLRQDNVGQLPAAPLVPEDLAPGERVLVPGSVVYIHGPLPQVPQWDVLTASGHAEMSVASREQAKSGVEEDDERVEVRGSAAKATVKPTLCVGEWVWELAPSCKVTLVLLQDGRVIESSSGLSFMSHADTQGAVPGGRREDGAGRAHTGWIDLARFRVTKVSGTWDAERRSALTVELEGADDLGAGTLTFTSTSDVEVDARSLVVPGEVAHRRRGQGDAAADAPRSRPGKLTSSWILMETQDASVEVQIFGFQHPPSANAVHVVTGPEAVGFLESSSDDDMTNFDTFRALRLRSRTPLESVLRPRLLRGFRDPTVQQSMVLLEGEHVDSVLAEGGAGSSMPQRLRARTNFGRSLSWPPLPDEPMGDRRTRYIGSLHQAPEGNEIVRFRNTDEFSTDRRMSCKLLEAEPAQSSEHSQQSQSPTPQQMPEGVWEGTLKLGTHLAESVRCWFSSKGATGEFTASLQTSGGVTIGNLLGGETLDFGVVRASLTLSKTCSSARRHVGTRHLEGRRCVDASHRVCLLLVAGEPFAEDESSSPEDNSRRKGPRRWLPDAPEGIRLAVRSNAAVGAHDSSSAIAASAAVPRSLSSRGGRPMIDGPNLVYHGLPGSTGYLLHTAQEPWTQQIASEHLVAEVVVQQLSSVGGVGGGGLAIGLSDMRSRALGEVLSSWPGRDSGLWLWRSDGAIARGPTLAQKSALWRFGAGDSVGFAVGRSRVCFLRNGERVHSVPRRLRGEKELAGGWISLRPMFVVALNSDAVLRLHEGTQHLGLFEDARSCEATNEEDTCVPPPPSRYAGTAHCDAAPLRARFRHCVRAVSWLARLQREAFAGPAAWGQPSALEAAGRLAATTVPSASGETEADVWVECTFSGTAPCFSKGRAVAEEVGGEHFIKELFANQHVLQTQPDDEFAEVTAADVQEVFVNQLGPMSSRPFTTARVSASVRRGRVERFRQARLERTGATWRLVEMLGDGSGRRGLCQGLRHLPPGSEVVALSEEGGWLQVASELEGGRTLWYPIQKEGSGPRFVRKRDLVVTDSPVYACSAAQHFPSCEPSQASRVRPTRAADRVGDAGLPGFGEPYTVEACIRVPYEENGHEMCIVAWGDEQHPLECGLAVHDVLVSASGTLRGSKKVCDGAWHHVACTFDGRERRLWVDYALVASDSPGTCHAGGLGAVRQDGLVIGAYPLAAATSRQSSDNFKGDIKRLRIWRSAVPPALMKAYAVKAEAQVRDEIIAEGTKAVFAGMDQRAEGRLVVDDLGIVFGSAKQRFLDVLDVDSKGFATCEDWRRYCMAVKSSAGEDSLMQFLQACVRNLGQGRRPLQVRADSDHQRELLSELSLSSKAYGWRVEASPLSLSDAMLELIEDEGLERFRRQVRVAQDLIGESADEAIVELADRVALQRGGHDDCWAKMLNATEWSQAQPKWLEQAVAHAKLEELTTAAKLREVLAWTVASGTPLGDALRAPFNAFVAAEAPPESPPEGPAGSLAVARTAAESSGGSSAACGPLAAELLRLARQAAEAAEAEEAQKRRAEETTPQERPQGTDPAGAPSAEAAVDAMFREVVGHMLFVRFLILLEMNWSVSRDFLPLIDLAAPADSAYGRLLAQVKPRLLGHLKFAQFQHVLQHSKYEGAVPSVLLNRKAAVTLRERGRVDWEFRRSLIGQLLSEMRKHQGGPKLFRRPWQTRCMKVQFKGEGGEDAGGLYREALDAVAQELHSKAVPLFVPCPNAIAEVGDNRDAWLLNPRATAPECIRALEFVGQLLGLALRTGDLLPLTLAPFTWKGIVGDERKRDDVRSIDVFAEKHLAIFSVCDKPDEEALAAMGGLQFAYPDVTGEEVELLEGGREISVTLETSSDFARLLLHNRLTFDHFQLQALHRGLATVVPIQLLRLWSWRDLQERVCGVPEVDLENLKRHTTYKNCTSTNVHVGYMWQALASFTQKQRRSFLRFVWGRSSLPTVDKWERNFTVQLLSGTGDSRLPCSHTCFFTLDLPSFSSAEICQAKLLYCITHCLAIDADGAAARSLNWDEDDED